MMLGIKLSPGKTGIIADYTKYLYTSVKPFPHLFCNAFLPGKQICMENNPDCLTPDRPVVRYDAFSLRTSPMKPYNYRYLTQDKVIFSTKHLVPGFSCFLSTLVALPRNTISVAFMSHDHKLKKNT